MNIEKIISEMTFEEKANFLTGRQMGTNPIERFNIEAVNFADGPHGVRTSEEKNCTHFPNLCALGSSWDVSIARKMGNALANDCIENDISMLLGPGINIKRNILCGRNFEYLSEDPVLSGELGAGYINGLQEKGISACLKHFAVNSQETDRSKVSAEIDERTLREIYLKGFEIAIKKSHPRSVMCAYNKVNALWCSENIHLLKDILEKEWEYDGMVVSDWGAVQNISRAVNAELHLQMPHNNNIVEQLKNGLEQGIVTMEQIDNAVRRVLKFVNNAKVEKSSYDRNRQHEICREIASAGIVLMKNEDNVLPITYDKYKKIAIVGEYGKSPLISGQGSAEVHNSPEFTDSPFEELKKCLPEIEFKYIEAYKKREFSSKMLWPEQGKIAKEIADCDLVVYFMGSMESEDTEYFDRRTAYLNPNFEMNVETALRIGKKVVVVLQNGGAMILGHIINRANAIVDMWLCGEAAGSAIASVLSGKVNPSGKLAETFPKKMRSDIEFPGNGMYLEYKERFDVGYRYYDKNPQEILYPFGHGLSYTTFEYSDLIQNDLTVEFTLKNTGEYDGAEVVQLYVGDTISTVVKPIKELKKFEKVYLKKGENTRIKFVLTPNELSYYNTSINDWVTENGRYDIYIGSSSRDIRLKSSFIYNGDMPYSIQQINEGMIG